MKFWKNKDTLSDMKISYDSLFNGKELGVNKVRSGPKEKLKKDRRKGRKRRRLSFIRGKRYKDPPDKRCPLSIHASSQDPHKGTI